MRILSKRSLVTIAIAVVIMSAAAASFWRFGVKGSRPGTVASDECEDFVFVPCPRQTATISLPIGGSSFALSYASDRVPGRSIDSSLDARPFGLGGWSLDVLHAYDVKGRVLVFGNGQRRLVEASPVTLKGEPALAVPSLEATEIYVFDTLGRHLQTMNGMTGAVLLQFQWTEAGVATITEPGGRVTRIRRDTQGVPITIVSAHGHRTRLGTRDGWLAAVVGPSRQVTQITTRADGLVTVVQDAAGARTSIRYEGDGRLAGMEGPNGSTVTFKQTTAADGYTLKTTTGGGRTWSSLVRRKGERVFREYTDADGHTTKVEVQGTNRLLTTADGTTYRFKLADDPRWAASAAVPSVEIQTPSGRRSTVTETRVGGAVNGELAPQANSRALAAGGATWRIAYEPSNGTITTTGAGGVTQTTRLNENGRPMLIERSGFAPVSYAYDTAGRSTRITQGTAPNAREWRYEFDPASGAVKVTDPSGRPRTVSRDALGWPVRVTAPAEQGPTGERDALGRITAFSAPGRGATRWTYRLDSRVDTITSPAGAEGLRYTTFGYDTDGVVTGVQFADGRGMAIERDGSGRVISVNAGTEPWRVSYDKTGAATTYEGPGGKLERRFDGLAMVTEAWSGAVTSSITRELDAQSRVVADDVGGSSRVEYRYDEAGRLVQAGELSMTRDSATGRIAAEHIGTLERIWRYNAFGEVIGTAVTAAGKPIYDLHVVRDALGRVIERSERLPNAAPRIRTFTYDAMNRLASAKDNARQTTFVYDVTGNLVREASAGGEIAATYDGRDELTRQGNVTFAYDPAGRLSSATTPTGKTTYDFDRAGHLLSVTLPSGMKIGYTLDGVGRRIGRSIDGRVVNRYAYADALRPAGEIDATGKTVARFVYALPSSAPTYVVRGAKSYLVVTDDLGTPRLLIDAAGGTVVEEIDIDAWGRSTGSPPSSLPFGFAGGLTDPDTGLIHFGARDYDPVTARWTAPDPLGVSGGDANRYRYASGDPVNRIDTPGTCDVLSAGVTVSGGWILGGSAEIGIVKGGTDYGGYGSYGAGFFTPGFGLSVNITCLYDTVPPGATPVSPLERLPGQGMTGESVGVVGGGADVSLDQEGNTTLAGGHLTVGTGLGASAQSTNTGVWCWTCPDVPILPFDVVPFSPEELQREAKYREDFKNLWNLDHPPPDPENEQNICNPNGTCDPDNPDVPASGAGLSGPGSHGDPHLRTSDGLTVTFMAVGEFTALRSESRDMVVQVRQVPFSDSRWVSVNSAVALDVNGDRLTVQYSREALVLRVKGVVTTLQSRLDLPHGGFIVPEARSYLIGWPDGSRARLYRNVRGVDLSMQLAPARIGTVHGLLGPFTGKGPIEVEARDGTRIGGDDLIRANVSTDRLYRVFGDSWRLKQAESMLDYAPGESTATFTDRTFPDPMRPAITPAAEASARAICVRAGVPEEALAGCILDVAMTGEAGFAVTTAVATRTSAPPPDLSQRTPAAPATGVTTGTAMVAGTGKGTYFVYDAAGKAMLKSERTNKAVELPPGNYLIDLNTTGTKQPLTVREGQQATVTAGTAMVAGTGKSSYLLYDASGKTLVTTGSTNDAIELFPGDYVIELNNTKQPLTVREGQQATVTAGTAMVTGTGKNRYFVSDASGKGLTNADTNTAVQLFPGNYTVGLNGTTQPLTVRAGQGASVTPGTAMVTGTGKNRYFVSDPSGKSLTNADTNTAVELFPGNYTVGLNGTTQPLTVRAGQGASVTAGTAMVTGTGKNRYFVSDASGKSLTNADTNTAVELFPGNYTVGLNGTTQPLTVRAGQGASVTAGTAMVTGTGKNRYFVSDASGKSLSNADTNTAVELFPGNYTVGLNGTTQPLTVRAGQGASVTAGTAMVTGTGKNRYFVSDASGKSLTNVDTNTAVELFPGNYVIELDGVKQPVTVRPGQQADWRRSR